jgi:hypothetical protein
VPLLRRDCRGDCIDVRKLVRILTIAANDGRANGRGGLFAFRFMRSDPGQSISLHPKRHLMEMRNEAKAGNNFEPFEEGK